MAGTNPAFSAADFRSGVTLAMNMGLPTNSADRPTFYFQETTTYPVGTPLDENGRPYDPSIAGVVAAPSPVQVPCAVEFSLVSGDELPIGMLRKAKATLTVLDTDWPAVSAAVEVDLGGDRYVITDHAPPIGMFEVTVYTMICYGKQEK